MVLPKGTPLFPLGRVVATPGALEILESTWTDTLTLLRRHASGDWGEVPSKDAKENELSTVQTRPLYHDESVFGRLGKF